MMPRFLSPGPLFALEMTTSVRRARYFAVRVLYAAVLLLLLFNIYQASFNRPYYSAPDRSAIAQFSWIFFLYFSMLQLLAVVVAGPAMAAGTIASEREHRTIEYLFASTLSNAEIIFGKLLARLMHLGYLVLVGMPILFIAMLMGGIAPEAIVVLMIVTLSTALTVSIISITVSVWTARARDAVMRAYLVLIVLLLLPTLIWALPMMLRYSIWGFDIIGPLNEQFLVSNPFWVLGNILQQASSANPAAAWGTLLALLRNHAVVCVLGITVSCMAVRRVHLRAGGVAPKRRRRRFHLFRPTVSDRPMLWKELIAEPAVSRLGAIGRIATMLILISILTPTVLVFYFSITNVNRYSSPRDYLEYSAGMGAAIGCGGLLLIAARAAGTITSEKERDCWTSLISTPLEAREIILGKLIGNLWAARGVFVLLAIIWGLGCLIEPGFIMAAGVSAGLFSLLAVFASALGVIYSLWCRTSTRAIIATLATGIFVGGAYLFCCIPVFIAARDDDVMILFAGCIPFLLALPGIVYLESSHSKVQSLMIVTYVIGTIGYAFASFLLIAASIGKFDRFTGRTRVDLLDISSQKDVPPRKILPAQVPGLNSMQ